jgi:small conductance mechanosensitive channel
MQDSVTVVLSDTVTAAVAAPAAEAPAAEETAVQPLDLTDAAAGLAEKVEGWLDTLVLLLPNLVVAVLIVLAAVFVARLVRRGVQKVLGHVTSRAPQARNVVDLLATVAYVLVLAAGVFIALGVLNLSGVVTTLLAGAGIVGLALGFAFQDIASNFISGVLMAVRTPFVVGDIVETNGYMGPVREISLRETVLQTFQGQRVILPNSRVYGEAIVNYSTTRERRVDVACGVGYGDDLEQAERVAVAAVEGLGARMDGKPVQLYYTEFGDSSINFVVRFWVAFQAQTDFLAAQSEAIKAIKAAFDANGVTIPFPIRTLDFDPNGGVDLQAMLGGSGDGSGGTVPGGP